MPWNPQELLGVRMGDTGRKSCKVFLRGSEPWEGK
jgi:hypothetical protein